MSKTTTKFNASRVPHFRSDWSTRMADYLEAGIQEHGITNMQVWVDAHLPAIIASWGDPSKLDRVVWLIRAVFPVSKWRLKLIQRIPGCYDDLDRESRKSLAAACSECGGWTSCGGMSHHADGPEGCTCHRLLKLHPFTESDWYAFAGCESKSPTICYVDEGVAVLVDGCHINVYVTTDGSHGEGTLVADRVAYRVYESNTAATKVANALLAVYESVDRSAWTDLVTAAVGPLV